MTDGRSSSTRGQRLEVIFGWVLMIGSTVLWPISAFTWAKHEPQTVLALSWFAVQLSALTYLKAARVHRDEPTG